MKMRQVAQDPISAGRQLEGSPRGFSGTSREEAPEEMVFRSRDAAPGGLRIFGERSETRNEAIPRRAAEHRMALAWPGPVDRNGSGSSDQCTAVGPSGSSPGGGDQMGSDA
jgi:hypothetical protein